MAKKMDLEMQRIKKELKNKSPVFIHLNDETGMIFYSVVLKSDPEFWLDSFETEKKARDFVKKHKLPCDDKVVSSLNPIWYERK